MQSAQVLKKSFIILLTCLNVNAMAQSDLSRGHLMGDGLYVSWSVGGGLLAVNERITGTETAIIKTKGGAGGTNIRIGTSIKDNFLLHAELLTAVSGELFVNMTEGLNGATYLADNIVVRIYALGTSYYFMPSNIFISGSVGLGTYEITANLEEIRTEPGLGLIAKVGKDWWLAKNWDVGLSCELGYLRVDEHTVLMDEVLSGIALELSLNVTFH